MNAKRNIAQPSAVQLARGAEAIGNEAAIGSTGTAAMRWESGDIRAFATLILRVTNGSEILADPATKREYGVRYEKVVGCDNIS
jgi:hypothetical protein